LQATCLAPRPAGIPPEHPRPVRVFSQDARRVGGLTVRRRRLTAVGVQPVGTVPHVLAWVTVYGAVAPTTGERCFLALPCRNPERCQLFVDTFAQAFPDSGTLLLLDNRGIHRAQRRMLPANVRLVFLPPACPERHPMERRWRDLKDDVAWPQCMRVEAQQDDLGQL
jgi:hypothetical protein